MADAFSRKVLRVVVAQLSQTIGWHGIQSTPLELMIDILHRYLEEIGKLTHRYSEQFGHTMPNLDDVGLAFRDMGINLQELEEYIKNVDSVACTYELPKYPIPRDSHLNFLKPGSREVVTRPVHVHEHLPPMHPEMEEEEYVGKQAPLSIDIVTTPGTTSPLASPKTNVFKRPGDPISLESPALKRARLMLEEEGRPLREISSVMMTTSGFLSPAREGKLPESRTPLQPSDSRSNSPQPSSYPMVPPEVKGEKKSKKIPFKKATDGIKKIDKENKKKEHRVKEASKVERNVSSDDSKVKKLVSMKELTKLKALKSGALKMMAHSSSPGPSTSNKPAKVAVPKTSPSKSLAVNSSKCTKSNSQIKIPKVEKSHPTPPPIQQHKIVSSPEKIKDGIIDGKLSAEPDKQKLNIFKKISKVKEEKVEKLEKIERPEPYELPSRDSRESSPGLIIDESELNSRQREARMAQIDDCIDAVIQRSMEIVEDPKPVKELKSPITVSQVGESSSSKVEHTINEVVTSHQPDSDHDAYMFDDYIFPPGTPSTPKTPELPTLSSKFEKPVEQKEQKEKKRKKDKSKSKKDVKGKSTKGSANTKKIKVELKEPGSPEKPKTPEYPELHDPPLSAPVFPFFPHFPPAPGLIPPPIGHPLFPRFPLHLGKNLPHPAMPNLPLPPPLFMQPRGEELPEPKEKSPEKLLPTSPVPTTVTSNIKTEKEKVEKLQTPAPSVKEKSGDKKIKEHKKEKKDKDKTKKKKDRKDKGKGKDKGEKKKIKVEKKERDKDKLKEKKEKKEKRKEKEREEKSEGGVPKITFRLGPASPRPPTPDAQLRKIVIRPVLKKQIHEEGSEKTHPNPGSDVLLKREPSPELARISALITRPPKPKSSSKTSLPKQDPPPEILPSSQASLPPTSVTVVSSPPSSSIPSSPNPSPLGGATVSKVKKALKPITKVKAKDMSKKIGAEVEPQKEPVAFYYDNDGNKVWICPACGGQDDGSPMIGCDDCDAWYHWVCVGIQVPPDENEDWYCRVCIVKKQENIVDKKKKSRKRKLLT